MYTLLACFYLIFNFEIKERNIYNQHFIVGRDLPND